MEGVVASAFDGSHEDAAAQARRLAGEQVQAVQGRPQADRLAEERDEKHEH